MDPILSILAQAFMAGLALACTYLAGAFVIRSRERNLANFFRQKSAAGVWLFISGFVVDLVAYLTLA